jgi:hypothetical protein
MEVKTPDGRTRDTVQLRREELYDLVWLEPITKVAPRYGISDVGAPQRASSADGSRGPGSKRTAPIRQEAERPEPLRLACPSLSPGPGLEFMICS